MENSPKNPIKRVDYNQVQHDVYAKGRVLPQAALQRYMDAFGRHLPARRPLTVIDLGSGTGRFAPSLADSFGGPVYGVEPADGMRRVAEAEAAHRRVQYLTGEAAAIPLPVGTADFVLMFMSFHHVADRAAAAQDIARVVKPGGRVILRSTFRDRIPDNWWRGFFPGSWALEEAMFPSQAEARAVFEAAGFATVESVQMEIPFEGNLNAMVAQLRLRAVSTFEHMTSDELDQGFARLDAALVAGTLEPKSTFGDFIVFARR